MEVLKEDGIFDAQISMDIEVIQSPLIIYLIQNEDVLVAGEILLDVFADGQKVAVVESLLKSPEDDDAGFIMFEARVEDLVAEPVEKQVQLEMKPSKESNNNQSTQERRQVVIMDQEAKPVETH